MIGARELDDQFSTSVEAAEPDRAHDGLGPGHVEAYFLLVGDSVSYTHLTLPTILLV